MFELQKKYPNKAGKIEQHHIDPKYMGSDPKGPKIPLDGAYHQEITNEFRKRHPYGGGTLPVDERQAIMEQVYKKLPLPPDS